MEVILCKAEMEALHAERKNKRCKMYIHLKIIQEIGVKESFQTQGKEVWKGHYITLT